MKLIQIPVIDIDTAGVAIDVPLPAAWLAEQLAEVSGTSAEPGHLRARLSLSAKEVVVRGRVEATVTVPCARCLEPATVHVDTELSLLLKPVAPAPATSGTPVRRPRGVKAPEAAPTAKPKHPKKDVEYEFSADEADTDTYDGENVVLDPFVREAILLEMPIFPLCSEACPGIGRPADAPEPVSAPPAIDPRLAPLGALREKLSQNESPAKRRAPDAGAKKPQASKPTSKKPKKE